MTKQEAARRTHMYNALQSLGFTFDECEKLRRISMTLRRWHELECGTGDGQVSVSVERDGDEPNSKPYKRIQYPTANGYVDKRYPIADRETGARKRLGAIVQERNRRIGHYKAKHETWSTYAVHEYIQGDPRGAALYILRPGDIPEGQAADSCYSRGICIY